MMENNPHACGVDDNACLPPSHFKQTHACGVDAE